MRHLMPATFVGAFAAVATLAACANVDNAGYILPSGSLAGTTAIVTIVSQDQLTAMARQSNVNVQRGYQVNGLAYQVASGCAVYLAETENGFDSLRHELWHCKGWKHD